ncbi:hypothetical protein THC_1779 [Caldimicrobium thiodismutans]|jgi:hypothetical protein|uniref:Cytochrome c domain-containing protein n=1 Tax=Caldimicrobium thiodismutans TaxID=1653476 RepID=A0A0U4W501_9BACT|nr:hypothetical protein [Caldimicrobium thiodismutans]BAU24138.1 hypothetical protein THC_1779 [Caldimicrobium thiodismutans]
MRGFKLYSFSLLIIVLSAGILFVLKNSGSSSAQDFKCLKCHKGKDSLEKYVQEKKITSAEEFRKLVRQGPKAGLHLTSSDEDLERAIKYLGLK